MSIVPYRQWSEHKHVGIKTILGELPLQISHSTVLDQMKRAGFSSRFEAKTRPYQLVAALKDDHPCLLAGEWSHYSVKGHRHRPDTTTYFFKNDADAVAARMLIGA